MASETQESTMSAALDEDAQRKHYGADDALDGLGSDERYVYLIVDGERHHYAADSAWAALKEHETTFECEAVRNPGEDVTVTLVKPDAVVTVTFEDMPRKGTFPPSFTITRGEARTTVAATAADWAYHERADVDKGRAVQLCSSMW